MHKLHKIRYCLEYRSVLEEKRKARLVRRHLLQLFLIFWGFFKFSVVAKPVSELDLEMLQNLARQHVCFNSSNRMHNQVWNFSEWTYFIIPTYELVKLFCFVNVTLPHWCLTQNAFLAALISDVVVVFRCNKKLLVIIYIIFINFLYFLLFYKILIVVVTII